MKHFVFKTFLFIFFALGIFHVKAFFMLHNARYTKKVFSREVYLSIEKSKKKNPAKKVLLGDSVGKQFYDNEDNNDTVNSLACNQAISLAGQYILLQNYIEAGNKIDTAFIFFTPFSFLNNLDQVFTYNYFIKPFYRDENLALMTPLVKQQVSKIPFSSMAFYPLILTTNWTPDYTSDDPVNYTILSPISIVYMHKMSALAKANNFKLVLVSAPLSVKKKKEVEMLNRREISENQLQQEFEGFFESIVYLDESNFVDGIHLKHPEQFKGRYKNLIH